MKNKRGFEFSFGWIFAIIVGAVIIFLAVYAATGLVRTEKKASDTESAAQLSSFLNPVETNLESGKISKVVFPSQTRIYNKCNPSGTFGYQEIRVAGQTGIGNKWDNPGAPIIIYDKYLFSDNMTEGKEFSIFSKPFDFPYRTASLIFMWSGEYCFINPPQEMQEEIESWKTSHINVSSNAFDCPEKSTKVCFSGSGCDIDVSIVSKTVKKKGKILSYESSLIYGAIFSEPDLYECQVKRVMKRSSELALIYEKKSERIAPLGCPSNMEADLIGFASLAGKVAISNELRGLNTLALKLKEKNDALSCKLF